MFENAVPLDRSHSGAGGSLVQHAWCAAACLLNEKLICVDVTKTKALLHSTTRLLKVDQAQTAFEFFTKSERISEDISLALTQRDAFQMNIVLRQWVDIDIDMEFRGFVCNGRLNALSQYNHIVTFDRLRMDSEYQSDIQQRILAFWDEEIKLRLAKVDIQRCIVDFALTGRNRDRLFVIELNPFQTSTDSALFSWKTDRFILENGPFEFCIRQDEDESLCSRLGVEWRDFVDKIQILAN